MNGLPQAGIIAQELLAKWLKTHGYTQSTTTPGLWKQKTRPISFSLVDNDFGMKYFGEDNAQHLLQTIQQYYKCLCNWDSKQYCRLTIKDYAGHKVHLSMPMHVEKNLKRFGHPPPSFCTTNPIHTSRKRMVQRSNTQSH
jgi:hypothetical protein